MSAVQRGNRSPGPAARDAGNLAAEIIASSGRAEPPFGLYVFSSADPGAELARAVEREVFLEVFGNTPELLGTEYGPYEAASVFLCVLDHRRGVPAGMIRLLAPSPAGCKTLHDIERFWDCPVDDVTARTGIDLDLGDVWDMATLAVAREYRGAASNGLVSLALYQGLGVMSHYYDARWGTAILDLVVLDLLQSQFHHPFSPFAGLEPRRYLDSPASLPVYLDVPAYRSRLRALDDSLYELIFRGHGLEPAVSPPDWEEGVAHLGLAAG